MNRIPILIQGNSFVKDGGGSGGSGDEGFTKYALGYDPLTDELVFSKDDVETDRLNITPEGGNGGGGGSSDDSGNAVLSSELVSTKEVGGIASGRTFAEGTTLETVIRSMLSPVLYPTLTNPSATLTTSAARLMEVGTTANVTLTASFNRGAITPKYSTSGQRAGAATGYILNGGEEQHSHTFSVEVSETNKSFTVVVNYAEGEQPVASDGSEFSEALPAGSVASSALTFEFVEPLYSNASDITTIKKEALVSKSAKTKTFSFPSQTVANPEQFCVPADWNVTAVEVLNTLNNQWVSALSEFAVDDVEYSDIPYKRYTYNVGINTGERQIRIKWS